MGTFKKTKVVMLPTNEKAVIGFLTQKGKERGHLVHFDRPMPNILDSENQHLYFISDEEIKEGDYNVPSDFSKISDISRTSKEDLPIVNDKVNGYKKIIATTDSNLTIKTLLFVQGENKEIDVLLPQPSQSFIEKFVEEYNKGNVITEVMVEYEDKVAMDGHTIIGSELKISKDNTITIRKVKDSWNRDEVIEFAKRYARRCQAPMTDNKWFEENL